jgi:hypothetical protein
VDDTLNTNQNPQPVEQQTPTAPQNPLKGKITKILKAVIVTAVVVVILIIALFTIDRLTDIKIPGISKEPEEEEEVVVIVEDPEEIKTTDQWDTFASDEFSFFFKYPNNSKFDFLEPTDESFVIHSVSYSRLDPTQKVTESELTDGYIFKVVSNVDVLNKDPKSAAEQKRASFVTSCPETAEISKVSTSKNISGSDSSTFTVKKCGADYIEYFILFENNIYEIAQIYRGDIGYKQSHRGTLDLILSTFRFYEEYIPDTSWKVYEEESQGIKFSYPPSFSADCCTVSPPIFGNFQRIIELADENTTSGGTDKPFNGIGIYRSVGYIENRTFADALEEQKQALIENYRLVLGKYPDNNSESSVNIGGKVGVLLTGYDWIKSRSYIYLPLGEDSMLVIVKTDIGNFEETFQQIIDTFEFI